MPTITFFSLGNADSSLIEFADDRLMLIDFFQRVESGDENDKRTDLSQELRNILEDKDRDYLDVVAFTHRDSDHIQGAHEFFWLEWAKVYQGDDRVQIRDLWVPACLILGVCRRISIKPSPAPQKQYESQDYSGKQWYIVT